MALASRMSSNSLYNLKSIPDVTITEQLQPPIQPLHQPRISQNGDCQRFRASAASTASGSTGSSSGGRKALPMSLKKCVLIDSKCSLQKFSLHKNPSSNHNNTTSTCIKSNPEKRNNSNALSNTTYKIWFKKTNKQNIAEIYLLYLHSHQSEAEGLSQHFYWTAPFTSNMLIKTRH